MAFQTHLLNYFFIVFLVEVHTWSNICKWACIKKKWKSWNIKQIYLQRPPEHRHAVWNKTHISHNPIYTCFWGSVIYNMKYDIGKWLYDASISIQIFQAVPKFEFRQLPWFLQLKVTLGKHLCVWDFALRGFFKPHFNQFSQETYG